MKELPKEGLVVPPPACPIRRYRCQCTKTSHQYRIQWRLHVVHQVERLKGHQECLQFSCGVTYRRGGRENLMGWPR